MYIERYALIGHPIHHSPSAIMHNMGFDALGIKARYELCDTKPEHISLIQNKIEQGYFKGCNITTPFKEIFSHNVDLQGEAKLAGAINTLWYHKNKLVGSLTDIDGIRMCLSQYINLQNKNCLIIGTGGVSRAAIIALKKYDCCIYIAGRNILKAKYMVDSLNITQKIHVLELYDKNSLKDLFPYIDVIIQATPIGFYKEEHDLPWEKISSTCIAFEMLYLPVETPFLLHAKKYGCKIIKGFELLIAQGIHSFELWTNQKAPLEIMSKAVKTHIGI